MTDPGCDAVAHLIDLHAAGACAPDEGRAVRAHLDTCPACRVALDEARHLQGLLDIHYRQPAALARLESRVKAEARRPAAPPRTLSFPRLAAVAAMLLVTFGLTLLMTPTARPTMGLRMALAERLALHPPAPVRGKLEKMLDLDAVQARAAVEAIRAGQWPEPPRVDLDVVVNNPGPAPIELELGGPGFRCDIDLQGPEAVRRHSPERPEYTPFPRENRTIAPGGQVRLRLERLASQAGERVWYVYPAAPGEYILRVRLEAAARRGGEREQIRLTAPPWLLRVR